MMCEKNMKYGYNLKNSFLRGSGFEPSKRNKIGNGHGVLPVRCGVSEKKDPD